MLKQYEIKNYNFRLLILIIAISVLGVLFVGSARSSLQNKQIMGLALGLVALLVVSLMDYSYILNFYWLLYIVNIILLLLVKVVGDDAGGAVRWVEIAGIRFQPSEFSKIFLILFFAKFFTKYQEKINTVRILALTAVLIGVPLYLIVSQPALSTSIVVALIFCVLLFVSGLSYKIILSVAAVTIPMLIIGISIILQPGQKLLKGYQANRVLAWLQPEQYSDLARQQLNSKIAIGSGQLFGKGLNNNIISSVKNGNFISEPHTDFIFAVVGEELGFIGGCVIIVLLLLIALECLRIGRNAKDFSGTLICSGMAALIVCQSFVNICVATGLMPNTGIPLPFVSYGLTSLVSIFIGMGFVFNVGLQPKKY
ncbi:FtsW/RodA/SpoVE family cell cycle protein [Candidatus Galacturonibacter soehngenii]|uniref:Rod shape-determining protein RodA n=1 Tax=Candidatus Galacturonatibacter soehngenii TaxID=2307010 RepID=A0A7V7QMH8_9FIRM|nr:FtsW/RodA/SpoVE family cell cycle protein [Candidatus Galacturonibacter soehngenii]KAB1439635.1 rod shape-determining protein RodA [Candidatus Galacturonibacter soehngenii]